MQVKRRGVASQSLTAKVDMDMDILTAEISANRTSINSLELLNGGDNIIIISLIIILQLIWLRRKKHKEVR